MTTAADLSAQLEAERLRTARLAERLDDVVRGVAAARELLDDPYQRVHSWVEDHSVTDHHAHADLAGDLLAVNAVLERTELIGRQA